MSIAVKILLVALSGGIGAVCRYLIMQYLKVSNAIMGLDTLIINSSACFIIGICAGWVAHSSWSPEARNTFILLTMTGFCGGFSTFSAFTLDCVKYYEAGHILTWVVFGTLTVFIGLFGCALGYWIGHRI